MISFRHYAAIASGLVVLLLSGCRVGPKYQQPPAMAQAPPATYKESPTQFPQTPGEWKVAQPEDAMLRGKWWEIYGDPGLNALEEKLNVDNQAIKQSFANFMEARTLIAQARAQLYPTLTAAPTYSRARQSANQVASSSASTGRTTSLTTLGLDASWAPDLWGRVRNLISEEQYNAQVSAADLENVKLTEQATLALTFFEVCGQDQLRAVYAQTVADDQKALDYNRAQYETGVGPEVSVVEAENTLENAQAALTGVGVARAQFEHAIATLTGSDASTFSIPVKPLNATPPAVPIGLPSQLLERRPDIAASERLMASANAQIGVATAAFYPNLTLTADGGLSSATFKHLFDISSRFWSIGGSASELLYDAGLRRAAVNQYIEVYNADVASYRQTVLTAFQQVEDYVAAERILSQQLQQQQAAADSAQRFVEIEVSRYQLGIDPYINVVTAQTTLLSDQQLVSNLHTQLMTASVQLIEALGGGWDNTQLPTPAQVSVTMAPAETTIQR